VPVACPAWSGARHRVIRKGLHSGVGGRRDDRDGNADRRRCRLCHRSFRRWRQNSRLFPWNREFSRLFPISAVLVTKRARRINPLRANSRSSGNGNLRRPNRELNTPNRELYRRMSPVTAEHQKRTRKRPIAPSRPMRSDKDPAGAMMPPNLAFFEVDWAMRPRRTRHRRGRRLTTPREPSPCSSTAGAALWIL
jgi:hypothetical protein